MTLLYSEGAIVSCSQIRLKVLVLSQLRPDLYFMLKNYCSKLDINIRIYCCESLDYY